MDSCWVLCCDLWVDLEGFELANSSCDVCITSMSVNDFACLPGCC